MLYNAVKLLKNTIANATLVFGKILSNMTYFYDAIEAIFVAVKPSFSYTTMYINTLRP